MKESKLKGKVVTLNIVQKAMKAIADVVPAVKVREEIDFNIPSQSVLFEQYVQTVAELNALYKNIMMH